MRIKLVALIFSFSMTGLFANAQHWGGGVDQELFNWGFSLQYISANYKIEKNQNWQNIPGATDLRSISSKTKPGLALGVVFNGRITSNLDARFTPAFVISNPKVVYEFNGENNQQKLPIQNPTMIDFPVSIKLKSDRIKDFRAYLLGGIKHSLDISSNKKDNERTEIEKQFILKRNFLSYEAGIGFDIYFEYFKMSPEFKLAYSFKNLIQPRSLAFASPIDKAKLRYFTFSLFFE